MLTSGPMSIAYSRTNMYPSHVNHRSDVHCLLTHKHVPLPCQCHAQSLFLTHAQRRTLAMSMSCSMSIAYSSTNTHPCHVDPMSDVHCLLTFLCPGLTGHKKNEKRAKKRRKGRNNFFFSGSRPMKADGGRWRTTGWRPVLGRQKSRKSSFFLESHFSH